MGRDKIPLLTSRPNKDGTFRYYERVTERVGGKQRAKYRRVYPTSRTFKADMAISATAHKQKVTPEVVREAAAEGTFRHLIALFKPTIPNRDGKKPGQKIGASSIRMWGVYLKQFEAAHGDKLVADMRKKHLYELQDNMADMPGKANNYISHMRQLLEFACRRDMIAFNPAHGIPWLKTGEHKQWPDHVIAEVLALANPMLRLAIITALCSAQRISDIIRMRHDWIKTAADGSPIMVVPGSLKTDTPAIIGMSQIWRDEIETVKALAKDKTVVPLTLLYSSRGQPYADTDTLQSELRAIMRQLGYIERKNGQPVDRYGKPVVEGETEPQTLYSMHGLSKNNIGNLLESKLSDVQVAAIVGKTVETVRYYGRQKRDAMIAEEAAATVINADFGGMAASKKTNAG